MWGEESIYTQDANYQAASNALQAQISAGFAGSLADADPDTLSDQELLLWSAVHGLANLSIDADLNHQLSVFERMKKTERLLHLLRPVL